MRFPRELPWVGVYILLTVLPLGIATIIAPTQPGRPFAVHLSTGVALVSFALLMLQFALVSRLWPRVMPVATDALMLFHREMGLVGLGFAFAHPLLLLPHGVPFAAWIPWTGSSASAWGAVTLWLLVAIVVLAVTRRRLPLSYESWHAVHLFGSLFVIGGTVAHVLAVNRYSAAPALRVTLLAYAFAFLLLMIRYRVLRPLRLRRRPWVVLDTRDVGGRTHLLRLRPVGHSGFPFEPGQFVWLMTGRTPFTIEQHPISIASSAQPSADHTLEFAIKMLGDWSSHVVPHLSTGRRVWVDGAFGAFTPGADTRRRLVLIAGGIGIAPIRSMLLTLRDRRNSRPVHLFYSAGDRARAVFADEIDALSASMHLEVTYVFEQPETTWSGERGLLTADILARHLPGRLVDDEYFVCGPAPMMDAVERMLDALGVPASAINTERFDMV